MAFMDSNIQKDICKGSGGRKEKVCGGSGMAIGASESDDDDFRALLVKAVENIAKLEEEVNKLKYDLAMQNDRVSSKIKQPNLEARKTKEERQRKILQDTSRIEESVSDGYSLSDRGIDHKSMKKKRQVIQKDHCRLKDSSQFTSEDSSSSSSFSFQLSDMDRQRHKKNKRKVKSGAKVKYRPVVRTELWPHTIANEEDGDEVDSETIGLAKFFSCFTCIMMDCRTAESRGRAALLNAVSTVLEYLPWPEARTFHNLMMLKIEQDRINWFADFTALANNHVDMKVRKSLKEKSFSTGTSSSFRSYSLRGPEKGFEDANVDKDKYLHKVICWQWNHSTCSYGDNCKRWHACKTCAEAGKLGESHKASSHFKASFKAEPGERRV